MAEGLTIRRAAARTGVHPSTAFRWRHEFLLLLGWAESDRLAGWVEYDWLSFPYSRKGQRRLGSAARSRGVRPGQRILFERVSVWAICDRRGRSVSGLCLTRRPLAYGLGRELARSVAATAVFTDRCGPCGPAAAFARLHGADYYDSRNVPLTLSSLLAGTDTAHAFLQRLRQWLRRFRGVATRYMENYLSWHVYWDRPIAQGLAFTLLRWHDAAELSVLRGRARGR